MNMKNRPTNLSLPAKVVLKYTSHIKITNFGRDLDGNLFVKLLVDQENIRKKFWISLGELSYSRRETYNTINRFGGHIISLAAQREFETRLQLSIPKNSDTLVVTKIGWVDNNFIMPYGVIGNKKRRIVVLLPSSSAKLVDKYICSGTVEGAKELMALAGGNSPIWQAKPKSLCSFLGLHLAAKPVCQLVHLLFTAGILIVISPASVALPNLGIKQ
jgi:hypothetical protein